MLQETITRATVNIPSFSGSHSTQERVDILQATKNDVDLIMMANEEGKFVYGSPSVQKSLGYAEEEYLDKSVFTIIHPESIDTAANLLQDVLDYPAKVFTIDLKLRHKNGMPIWVEGLAINLLHVPGVNALVGNFRNITERKKAEQEIRESMDLYRNLFNRNPVPICVCDAASLKFLEINEATVKHYGYNRKELLKMTFFGITPPEEHNRLKQLLESASQKQKGVTRTHIKKNREAIFVELLVHSIFYKGISSYLILANDITEKVHLQSQLMDEKLQWQKDLNKATINAQEKERQAIGRELHDNITQILTTAKLCLSCAAENFTTPDAMIERSINNINNAIEEIRTLSKCMTQTFHKEVGLKLSIEDLVENIRLTNSFQVTLQVDLENEQLLDDKLKMTAYRIIQEQLNNILKHAAASKVTIRLKQHAKTLDLVISDNGKGFDTSIKRKGIGISNIINRAELFNGYAEIISAPGNGCTVAAHFQLA